MADQRPGPIVGLILAAGTSSRLGRPKQLLELDGVPLVRIVAERCLASHLDRVNVVVGHRGDEVAAALHGLNIDIVENPRFADGQSTSLIAGLVAAPDADAVVIALADQPTIRTGAINALIDARVAGARIGMAAYGTERGHPILFGRELFGELQEISGDRGGREVIRRHAGDVVVVPGESPAPLPDVDTEEAWDELRTSVERARQTPRE
jgi:molybdenum cofactor cytidylyltransferase